MVVLSTESIQSQISSINTKIQSVKEKQGDSFASMLEKFTSRNNSEKSVKSSDSKTNENAVKVSREVNADPEAAETSDAADEVKESTVPATEKTQNSRDKDQVEEKKLSGKEESSVKEEEAETVSIADSTSVNPVLNSEIAAAAINLENYSSAENNFDEEMMTVNAQEAAFITETLTPSEIQNAYDFLAPESNELKTDNPQFNEKLEKIQQLAAENPEEFLKLAQMLDGTDAEEMLSLNEGFASLTSEEQDNLSLFELPVQENKAVFTITDERTEKPEIDFKSGSDVSVKAESVSDNTVNVTYSLQDNSFQNILSSSDQSAAATGSTFQEMLSQQIQTNIPDFVKAGSIVLKDNNQGTINLNLRPEALGNVKITLEVTDKVIAGKIVVASREAFEAFNKNLDQFRQSFQQNGFENAELTLSFADNNGGNFYQQNEQQQTGSEFRFAETYRQYSSEESSEISSQNSDNKFADSGNYTIDVVA